VKEGPVRSPGFSLRARVPEDRDLYPAPSGECTSQRSLEANWESRRRESAGTHSVILTVG